MRLAGPSRLRQACRIASLLMAPAVAATGFAAGADTHTPVALKTTFMGSEAHLKRIPPTEEYGGRGHDVVIRFARDGTLLGSFAGLGYDLTDTGNWSIEGRKLCTVWRNWDDGEKRCFTIFGIRGRYAASGPDGLIRGRFSLSR